MNEEDQAVRDLRILEIFELSLRNLAGPYEAASEVVSRLSGRKQFMDAAKPLNYQLKNCPPRVMITAVSLLRARLEEE